MRSGCALVALVAVVVTAACAPPPPVVTAPVAPSHPEFVYPVVPPGTAPDTADRVARGWRLLQARDVAGASREFTALVTSSRGFAPAHTGAGYVALADGRPADALPEFDRASPPDRPYAPALVGRGLALLGLGRDDDALTSLETALTMDRDIPDLAERVATLRVRVAQDRIGRAERAAATGRWDEARAAYRAAIASSPDAAFLYRDLAIVERNAGRPETAIELATAALVYDASDVRAHLVIAEVHAERGEFAAALDAYKLAAALEPSPAIETAMARVNERAREAALPERFRTLGGRPEASRADLAAHLGVRLQALLSRVPQRQVVVTDVRGHWAEAWMQSVSRSGAMEVYSNYTFQPSTTVRRGELADAVSRVLALIGPSSAVSRWDAANLTVTDVPPTHLAFPAVRRAVAAGILPLDSGVFGLLRPVSGAEVIEAVSRLARMTGDRR